MKFTEDIVPVTDFRNNAADILNQLMKTGRPIVLTQRGRASAVLMEVREYQRITERIHELEQRLGIASEPVKPAPGGLPMMPPDPSSSTDDLMAELNRILR
ncbi:MAG: type II toxin-antitoxin system Phd/YefM family antitoxin [Myxococcota bacterium]